MLNNKRLGFCRRSLLGPSLRLATEMWTQWDFLFGCIPALDIFLFAFFLLLLSLFPLNPVCPCGLLHLDIMWYLFTPIQIAQRPRPPTT